MFKNLAKFFVIGFFVVLAFPLSAQESMVIQNHTKSEEDQGKIVWEKMQNKEIACEDLSEEQSGFLGEYFMGQMAGDTHEAMNNMMTAMMGEQGEEQMHVVLGKRLSGCDGSAAYPATGFGFMPMMQMMSGFGSGGMMDNVSNFSQAGNLNNAFNIATFLLVWIVLILIIAALIKYLLRKK